MPVIINGSTGVSGTDGSASTPAVQGTDSNTGMFFPASDQIAFAEGGVEAMRLDASGNVGIGTTTPASLLQVAGTVRFGAGPSDVTNASLAVYSDGSGVSIEAFQGNAVATKRNLWLNAYGGNVGIGTSTPRSRLDIGGGELRGVGNIGGNSNSGAFSIWGGGDTLNGGYVQFWGASSSNPNIVTFGNSGGADRMRIHADGNVSIGTTGVAARLTVDGEGPQLSNQAFAYYAQNGAPFTGYVSGQTIANSIWSGGRVSGIEFNARSDGRLKKDVTPIPASDAWHFIQNVTPVHYKWISGSDDGHKFGFIAQDVVKAGFPNLIGQYPDSNVQEVTDADGFTSPAGVVLSVNYDQIVPVLASALRDALAQIEELKARVAALEAR